MDNNIFSNHYKLGLSSVLRGWTAVLLALAAFPAVAQTPNDTLKGEQQYRFDNLMQLWHNTNNAAGLSINASPNRGFASIGYQHRDGKYHRVQEGGMTNSLQFYTERYQQLGQYLYSYGKVDFRMGRTKDRAFADQYRPYNANPYQSGSAIAGKYDNQDIDIVAAVGTMPIFGWRFGIQLNYQLGDLARLRDPRSRSQLLDYRLTPSLSYSFDGHTIGLTGYYDRRKEKMGSLTTVQDDATLTYYLFSGMENATGTIGGYSSFNREWVNHTLGTELNYGFRTESFHSVNALGISRATEYVYGTYKYEPGRYFNYIYHIQSQNRLRTCRIVHQTDIEAQWQEGYADEYRQQLIITKDPETGITSYRYDPLLEFRKRFQVRTFDFSFRYRANIIDQPSQNDNTACSLNYPTIGAICAYSGFSIDAHTAKNRHLLPYSESDYRRINFQVENGISLFKHRLMLDTTLGYSVATRARLAIADPTTVLAQGVWLKDLPFYEANLVHGSLQVMYQFPLTIKQTRSIWFVKAFGDFASANTTGHPNLYNIGFSIGMFN